MTPQRILLVDDEPAIRRVLRSYLERDGFVVEEAADGASALEQARRGGVAAVLLDIGLPDIEGLEVLRQIRTFSPVYVLLVTARVDEVDRLLGLGLGADDYVTKPFSPREVVARVRAVLRRPAAVAGSPPHEAGPGSHATPPSTPALQFPSLRIDPDRREVVAGDRLVELSALEFDLLLALARTPRRVFTRRQLLGAVWGPDWFGDERVVDVHIRSLRRRLDDPAGDPGIIGTVRGVGYKFLLAPA